MEYGVSTKTITNWSNNRKKVKGTNEPSGASSGIKPIGEHEQGAMDGDLGKALAGAGLGGSSIGEISPSASARSESHVSPSHVPSLSPEQLLQLIKGIDSATIGVIVSVKAKHVPSDIASKACAMPKADEESLAIFAPYAADYAPQMLAYAKPAAALLFVGVWGLSVAMRVKALSALEKEYAERK